MITNFGQITTYTGAGFPHVNALIYDIALALTNGADAAVKTPSTGNAAPMGQQWMWQVATADASKFDKTKAYDGTSPSATDNITWVFEATQLIDPFAQITPDGFSIDLTDTTLGATYGIDTPGTTALDQLAVPYVVNPAKDPWRICFQTFNWKSYPVYTKGAQGNPGTWTKDTSTPKPSLAVYVGTPATLNATDGSKLQIGYRQSWPNQIPSWVQDAVAAGNIYKNYSDVVAAGQMPSSYLNKKIYDFVEPQGNTGARWTHNFETQTTAGKDKWGADDLDPAAADGDHQKANGFNAYGYIDGDGPDITDKGQTFVNRYNVRGEKIGLFGSSVGTGGDGAPMSYHMTLSDHGIFLAVWAQNPEEEASDYSWILIQRPVDKKTGVVRGVYAELASSDPASPLNSGKYGDPGNAGNRPLFCINSTNNNFYKFVVREHDLPVPSIPKDAANNSEDNGAVLNSYPQQSLTENGEYVITFVNNLNSSRFKYADELDMLGTVSADIVGGGTDIDVSVYNEIDPATGQPIKRTYHALWPHGKFGTKMRVVVVKAVPNPNAPA